MPGARAAAPAPFGPGVAAAGLAGVLGVQGLPALPPLAPSILLLPAAAWLAWRGGAWRLAGALLLGMALAALHGQWGLAQRLDPAFAQTPLDVEASVTGLPVAEGTVTRFSARVLSSKPERALPPGRTLQLAWFAAPGEQAPVPEPGSRWRFTLKLRPPRGLANPGGFDAERRALERRIAASGYVIDGEAMAPAGAGLDAWRARLSARIGEAVPGREARFVQALALGDTRALDDRDWEVLRATGLTHLIAISGFHVGLVAGAGALAASATWWLFPSLARRWPRPAASAVAALLAASGYTALAGFALPTVRTALMVGVVVLARTLRRPVSGAQSLSLAAIAILLVDPLAVLAPGFWLSFLGVAWLMWCLPTAPGQGVLRPFLGAQGVASLGLLPVSVAFFSQASLPGPLVNLVGIPWISLGVVPLALLGLGLDALHPPAAALAWQAAAWLMGSLWRTLEWIAGWPPALLWLPEPRPLAVLLALAGAFWLMLPRSLPGKPLAWLLLLPLLWPRLDRPPTGQADLVLLDVGQGLSLLVLTRHHALLFDAGPAPPRGMDLGEAAVVPALRALGVRGLDALVLSHGDNDHAGGGAAVERAMSPVRVWAPPGWSPPYADANACRAGEGWRWDGVEFRWLHPPRFFPYLRNDSSCVLRIQAGGAVALLPGDIGRHVEAGLARRQAGAVRADLLVVPHHGSEGSSSLDFLAAVRPRIALLPVGHDNRFDLPAPVVLGRYERYGVELLDTAAQGAIRARLGPDGVQITGRHRADHPRYWRHAPPGGTGYAIGGPPTAKVRRAGTDQVGRLGDGADHRAGGAGAGHHPGALLEPAAQGSAAAGPGRGGP